MIKFNKWIAFKITLAVSTMWAFYILVLYGLTPLIWPQDMNQIMYWSNFVQLIFLPLLAVGGAVIAERQMQREKAHHDELERRDQETHDATIEALAEVHEIVAELHDHHIGGREHRKIGRREHA